MLALSTVALSYLKYLAMFPLKVKYAIHTLKTAQRTEQVALTS